MPAKDYTLRILSFTCVAHALTHVYTIVYTPLLVSMGRDFELEPDAIAVFFSIMNVFFGVGAVPAGWLSDRLGEKILLVIFFFGCAIGGTLIGLAPNLWVFGFGAVVLGVATSIYHPVGTALISKGIDRRGRAMGITGIAGSIGTALGPVVGGIAVYLVSWRGAYLGLAAPTLVLGFWLAASDLGPNARPALRGETGEAPSGDEPTAQPGAATRSRIFILFGFLLLAMTIGGFYFHLVTTVLPQHLAGAVTAAASDAEVSSRAVTGGLLAGVALAFGMGGQFVAGLLCDIWDRRILYVINYVIIIPVVFLLGHADGLTAIVLASVGSAVFFAVQPIENTLIAEYTPRRLRGATYGAKFVLVFAVGGSGTWAAARIVREHSTSLVFDLATVLTLAALISAVVASRISVRAPDQTADGARPRT